MFNIFIFYYILKLYIMNTDNNKSNIPVRKQNLLKNQSEEVVDLLENYHKTDEQVTLISQYLKEYKNKRDKSKKLLQSKCNHEWMRDPPEYQTHTSWTCSICDEFTFHIP